MQLRKYQFILLVVLCMPFGLLANNIQPSNAKVVKQGTTNDTAVVQFDLSWENSWRHNSSSGGLSYIGVKTGGSGYLAAPKVYIGSEGSVAWQASTAVNAGSSPALSSGNNRSHS